MRKQTVVGMIAAVALFVSSSNAWSDPTPTYEARFPQGGASDVFVPFDFFRGNRIFLKGTINGRPADILLDSGADRTTVNQELVDALGLKATTSAFTVPGAAGSVMSQLYGKVEVAIGDVQFRNLSVHGMDLSTVGQQLGRPLNVVLGAEAFETSLVELDFRNRQIAFHNPKTFKIPDGFIRVPMRPEKIDGAPAIDISIEDRAPVSAIFDLGSAAPVSISQSLEAGVGLLKDRPSSDVPLGGVGGLTPHDVAILRSIRIGDAELHDVPAYFNRSATDIPTTGALVGMDIFSRFRVITDYMHKAIYLKPDAAALSQPFPKDRSGLRSAFIGGRLQVVFVSKGSPASKGDWKAGDIIVAIDGQKIGPEFPTSSLAQWKNGPVGRKVFLTLVNGSERSLTLADYY